jgi:hypothetical protein
MIFYTPDEAAVEWCATEALELGLLDFGLFDRYHLTRSRVAMESSTDEWPTVPPPACMIFPRCSFTLWKDVNMVAFLRLASATDSQVTQGSPIRRACSVRKQDSRIHTFVVDHAKGLKVVV